MKMKKIELKEYRPFQNLKHFYLMYTDNKLDSLIYKNEKNCYKIDLKNNNFIPKSGLLLCPFIEQICSTKKIKNVLDIGTGESCLLAKHAVKFGADKADAIDIDPQIVVTAEKNIGEFINTVHVFESDNFLKIGNQKYDLIVSNPAQMPMTDHVCSRHDVGGEFGRENIEIILNKAADYLSENGILLLLVFGFLGVNVATRKDLTPLIDISKNNFTLEKVEHYLLNIRYNGAIYRSIEYIQMIFPDYKFFEVDGKLKNEIYILQLKKQNGK